MFRTNEEKARDITDAFKQKAREGVMIYDAEHMGKIIKERLDQYDREEREVTSGNADCAY